MAYNRFMEKERKELDFDKYMPTIRDPFDDPQKFAYDINLKGQEAIREVTREYYSTTEDPSSTMDLRDLAEVFKIVNPDMGEEYIDTHTKEIVEGYVGHDLGYKGAIEEFKGAFVSSSNELKLSAKYFDLFANNKDAYGTEEFAEKLQQLKDYEAAQPLGRRSDYLNVNFATDMLVATGNILPSSIPSMVMYGLGGIVNVAAPGVGTGIARVASSGYTAYQEAGGMIKELVKQTDSEGNKLSDEAIWAMSQWTMAGVFGLNMVFDSAQRTMGKATELLAKKIFQKGAVSSVIKSGSSSVLKPLLMGGGRLGFDSTVEAVQEVGEDIISLASERVGVTKYNQLNDTDFTTATFEEAKKQLANTFTQTLKGMPLIGAFGNAVVTSQKILGPESSMKRDANKVTGYTNKSEVVNVSSIAVPKATPAMEKFVANPEPVEVVKVGKGYVASKETDASFIKSVKNQNVKAVNVEVVNNTGENTDTSKEFAKNIAEKQALGYTDNIVVYDSQKRAEESSQKFALDAQDKITGYTVNEDKTYTVSVERDTVINDVVFADKTKVTDFTKADIDEAAVDEATIAMEEETAEVIKNHERDIKEIAKKVNTADNKKVQNQIKKAMPQLSPVENKIAAATFGMMADAQEKTVDEFMAENYRNGKIFAPAKDMGTSKGMMDIGKDMKAVIRAGENADFSTFVHETFHVAFRSLDKKAEFSQLIQETAPSQEFKTWLGEHNRLFDETTFKDVDLEKFAETFMDTKWSVRHEEFVARLFEGYLADGKTASPKLKQILTIIADWMKNIYQTLRNTVDLDPRIIQAFDSMLDKETSLGVESSTEARASTSEQSTVLAQGQQATQTDAFKEWFGKSKTVDKKGDPLVVYHGTGSDFTTFNIGEFGKNYSGDYGAGFYFSEDARTANRFASVSKGTPNIMPVYLSLQNPLIINKKGATQKLEQIAPRATTEQELTNALIELGYDGVIIDNGVGGNLYIDEAVAFFPTQVKSVNNQGTFDGENPNILYQESPPIDSQEFKDLFANTKVVDEQENPLLVYHGTDAKFTEFDTKEGGNRKTKQQLDFGSHFSEETYAKEYSKTGNTIAAYLIIENPLNLADPSEAFQYVGQPNFDKLVKLNNLLGIKPRGELFYDADGVKQSTQQSSFINQFQLDSKPPMQVNKAIQEAGFDGLIYEPYNQVGLNSHIKHPVSYIVLSPSQVRTVPSPNILNQPELKPIKKDSKEYKEIKKEVQGKLKNKEYPRDSELAIFKGEEWADKEISFRRLYAQDDQLVDKFEKAYDAYMDEITTENENGEEVVTPVENENKRILEILFEQSKSDYESIEDSVGDSEGFVERMKQQIKLITPKIADQGFRSALSDDSYVKEVAARLTEGKKQQDASDISKYLFRLANDENPSEYTKRYAKHALIENLRGYRRMLYEMDGETSQLSYERAVEGTEIGEGVESIGTANNEVKNLLNDKDLSDEIRSMIENNIATDSSLTALIEDNLAKSATILSKDTSVQSLSRYITDIKEQIQEITAQLEEQVNETTSVEGEKAALLESLKEKSKVLSRAKADLKRVKVARDALKTKIAIKRMSDKIDHHAKSSVTTADARMTNLMQKFLNVLRNPNTEGLDYRLLLKNEGIEFNTLPLILKNYFIESKDGDMVILKSTFNDMTIEEVSQLEKNMRQMKAAARQLLTERKNRKEAQTNWVLKEFYAQQTGEPISDIQDYHEYVDNLKYERGPLVSKAKERQKNLLKARLETNFLTGERWIQRIDGKMDGAISRWIFGGVLEDGTLWKGVEGVADQETARTSKRYTEGYGLMEKLGLTPRYLISEFKIGENPMVTRNGVKITNQKAIGVYIYEKQSKGKFLLKNLDGNGFTKSEISTILDNMTDKQKKFGDWLLQDFANIRPEVEEIYYKENNKILTIEENYFPLIGFGDNAHFNSVINKSTSKGSRDPRHTFTEERTGEVYALDLDVVTGWAFQAKQQEHYIAGAEFFSQTQHLLNKHGGDLYSAISETKGPQYASKLQEFVDGLANNRTALDEADNAINAIRNNLVIARLGFNLVTALKQIPSIGAFATNFGVLELSKAFIQMGTHPFDTSKFIYEMAPQMENRAFTAEYRALMNIEGTSQYKLAKKGFAKYSMGLIKAMDKLVVNTLWIGSYNNSIAHNLSPELAAMNATKFINDTQPTGNFKDNAMIYSSKSPIWKFLLMFSNQLNKYFNIAYDIPFELKEHMYMKALGSVATLGLNTAGIALLSGGLLRSGDDDDDEHWEKVLGELSGTLLSIAPIAGPNYLAPIVKNSYFPDTAMPLVSELASLWSANKEPDVDKKAERMNNAVINLGFAGAETIGYPAGIGKKVYKSLTNENIGYILNSQFGDIMEERK